MDRGARHGPSPSSFAQAITGAHAGTGVPQLPEHTLSATHPLVDLAALCAPDLVPALRTLLAGAPAPAKVQLALDDPAVLRVELARGLRGLAVRRHLDGDGQGEITALGLLTRVLQPSGGRALADALRDLAAAHAASGDLEAAVSARGRAFRLLEAMARDDERLWPEVLIDAEEYTGLLHDALRPTDATVVSGRVARALERLVESGREGLRPEYARSLRLWGDRLAEDEEWRQAADTVLHSVQEFRRVGDRYAAALGLSRLSALQTVLDDPEEALASARGALAEAAALEHADPGDWRMSVCMATHSVARRLSALGREDEALDALLSVRAPFELLHEEAPEIHASYADYLEDLSAACAAAGAVEEALEAAEALVEARRAAVDTTGDLPGLALALLRLGELQRPLGHVGRAAESAREAAEVFAAHGDAEGRVHALCVLSDHLALLDGPPAAALEHAEEAVEQARGLGGRSLGEALTVLGNRREDAGDVSGAFEAAAEAVEVFRALDASPGWIAPALHHRAARARQLGEHDLALDSALEATALYQDLYEDDLSYGLVLAESLCLLGRLREAERRFEHALTAAERAVSLLERLHHPDFPRVTVCLAMSLRDAARLHERMGTQDKALVLARRAVTLYGELAKDDPVRFRPPLADAWRTLGSCLSGLGHDEDAYTAALFDVDLHRESGDRTGLAHALCSLGHRHEALGRTDEAIAVTRESLDVHEELLLLEGGDPLPTARTASRLAELLAPEDAVGLRERAITLFTDAEEDTEATAELLRLLRDRALAGDDVAETVSRVSAQEDTVEAVRALTAVADRLIGDGELEGAEAVHTQARALWDIHLLERPGTPAGPAAALWETEAALKSRFGLPDAAADAQAMALELLEPLLRPGRHRPAEQDGALARSLARLAAYLADADRPAEALPHQARATGLYESLATRFPGHRHALAVSLGALADLQARTGSPEAERTLARATALSSALPED
ncbi:tetratricopeptide repeat protein [Actinocorallia sp. API 0066]|uniref:tetratricopeptide repeat protein n=1 Tax=Actinocorallia sp. API 0066 TaxID=2896846 RepID=UPI001E55FECB|nr:tetratricopeptide repeat protein [Actinocorallia sp. API 0066]MCD0447992.1 tetratricopeptide repeat protein [Actinocorallia sp. API 0066]